MENQLHTQEKSSEAYNKIVKKVLYNIGLIGAILMSIAYIVVVIVLIVGFKTHAWKACVIFALVNTVVGLLIMQMLKLQGISFAKNIPENQEVIQRYYSLNTKDKKIRSIKYYWTVSVIKDVLIKGVSFTASIIGIIYICIEGSKDITLLLFAFVNLIMFTCFGILALNTAYEFYNHRHVQYMKERIKEVEKKKGDKKCHITKELV